jgi:hypothetical protein
MTSSETENVADDEIRDIKIKKSLFRSGSRSRSRSGSQSNDDMEYSYYKDICEYLLINPFPYKYFLIGANRHQLIKNFTYRWLFDINSEYRKWHINHYNSIYNKSGYKYTTSKKHNIIKGLELLNYVGHLDSESYKKCNTAFEKIVSAHHPHKHSTQENIKIITCVCAAIEYLSSHLHNDDEYDSENSEC